MPLYSTLVMFESAGMVTLHCVVLLHMSNTIYCVDSDSGDSLLTLTTTGLHRRLARVRASVSIRWL